MNIRPATLSDQENINTLYLAAFPAHERKVVAQLAVDLLVNHSTPHTITLIAEMQQAIIGHIAFSPVTITNNVNCLAYLLAPLAVQPAYQQRHIGSLLVQSGLARLVAMGTKIVFVYGDPKYYTKFGFNADIACNYLSPYELKYPFGWQAMTMNEFLVEKTIERISCLTALCHPELW